MKQSIVICFIFVLSACSTPLNPQPVTPAASLVLLTPVFTAEASAVTDPRLTTTPTEGQCGFVEGRQPLPEISSQLLFKLENAALPVKNARAEAYGENCIGADGSLVRFSARETDFYVTLTTSDLQDETGLGSLLEQTLAIIDQFPRDQTPGPNPGYIGISFEAGTEIQNLWFTRTRASDLTNQGTKGADLYRALKSVP
jgi:hypothetical protein